MRKKPIPDDLDTSTNAGFRDGLDALGVKPSTAGLVMGIPDSTLSAWVRGRRPPHPTGASMLRWLLDGYRPRDWHMTGPDFDEARVDLGLTVEDLADVLDADPETIVKWSSDFNGPPRMVATAMRWFLDEDFRPPEWPAGKD